MRAVNRFTDFLMQASTSAGCEYVDTAPFLDEYGFAGTVESPDPHHLSLDGETAFGRYLQSRALEAARRAD